MNVKELAVNNTIFECYGGSHAYGTNIETSDIDIRGLFVANRKNIMTPFFRVEQCQDFPGEDKVLYEITKFMKLLIDMNPNILEFLWVDESSIIMTTPFYDHLRSVRSELLSSKAKFTFSGYAFSQMKRIKGHNKWINNPIENKPRQVDFLKCIHSLNHNYTKNDFDINKFGSGFRLLILEGNTLGLYEVDEKYKPFNVFDGSLNIMNDDNDEALKKAGSPIFILKYIKNEYKHKLDDYNEYQRWKKNRNESRSGLEKLYGYDTKHAMHLLRLYTMGIEILETEQVNVKRPDAEYLLSVRNGKYAYAELLEVVELLEQRLEYAYKNTGLRRSVKPDYASDILMNLYEDYWEYKATRSIDELLLSS